MSEHDDQKQKHEHEGPAARAAEVVEEIREEIAEAVTHVPKSVRWTVGKLVRVTLLGMGLFIVVLVVTAVLFVMNRTEWVARELTLVLNQTLALRSDVELAIADLHGNPFSSITLVDPVVRFRDGDHAPLLTAPSLTVRYSAWNLLTGRRGIDLLLEAPVVRIAEDENGKMRLPVWRSGKAGTAVTTYDIRLRIRNGTVVIPDQEGPVHGIVLDAALHTGRPTRVEVTELRWDDAPRVGRLESLRGSLAAGDSVTFRVDEVRMPELALSAHGGWEAGTGNEIKARRMHVRIDRVRWTWLARAFINGAFDAPGEGSASVELTRDTDGRFRGRFLAQADWKGLEAGGSGEFSVLGDHLIIAPADAVGPGGRVTGAFEMKGKAWTLTGNVEDGDPSEWAGLGLVGWPEGDLHGRFRYDTAADGATRLRAALGASEIAGWRADSATVAVDAWPARADSFDVVFRRAGGDVRLIGETREDGWSGTWAARHFPLEEWPDGRATGLTGWAESGRGTVQGAGGDLHVQGDLAGTDARWFGALARTWRLEAIEGRLLPTPDLVTRARIGRLDFLGISFDSAASALHLGDAMLDMDTLRAFASDTLIEMDAHAEWDEQRWTLEAPRAFARSAQFDWQAEPPMRLSGDPRGVTFERLAATDGDARIELEGRWAVPGGSYDFSFAGTDLALGKLGLPLDWMLRGTADATLTVDGPAGDPRWRFEGVALGVGTGETLADSVHLVLAGRPHALAIERGVAEADGGRLEGRLVFEDLAAAWPDSLVPARVAAWLAGAARWNGAWTAATFPIDGWGALNPAMARAGGRLNGRVVVAGRPSRPELDARLSASPFSIDQFILDSGDAEVRYRNERLEVPEARFARGDVISTGSGEMALRLAMGEKPEMPERPMRWRLDAPGGDLSVLPLLVPQIAWAEGDFRMHATITGTPRAPVLDGSLRIEHGQVRLSAREEVLRDLTASLRFDASRITLDTLTAYQGRSGALSGQGEVLLDGFGIERYRFDLAMRDFTALESGLYSATFDGRFTITDGARLHGETLPHVTGEMEILQATILLDFTDASAMQQFNAAEQPLFWTYRVHMRATDKLRWTPPNANIEFSADLILDQNVDSLSVFGDVDALRGQYWFFSNRFDVQRANLQFDNVGGLDPQLDIEATTQLTPVTNQGVLQATSADGSSRPERQTVTVRISGRSRNPVIEFSSSPDDLAQNVILEELTFGRYTSGPGDFGDPFDDYLTRAINRQLSAEMSKLFQGYVSDWALTREYGGLLSGEGELYAEVGIPLNNQWQLRYRQRVPGAAEGEYSLNPFERDIEVEYRLNRFFYVTSEFAERKRAQSTTLTPEFNVNLKARWEY